MFNLDEIKELIELVDKTSVHELELENEGSRLCIRKPGKTEVVHVQPSVESAVVQSVGPMSISAAAGIPAAAEPAPARPTEQDSNLHTIVSPMVGTFYRASSPDANSFVNVGDRVGEKTVVCIIEAMKLMNELEAEVKGQITEVLVENGQLVEYGQPLFLVKPE
ncbi:MULTISPECIES: acetyl-CoA carboxylase biotin carboxyl carrier protein [unclassified Paenibacillus]|uniref:acetyl-CoA carboxylase biotin carboxyl carrier protein n=1 Tax=unclassified Paenibacillus TaxID=185978 RepID=UPI000839C7B6|nr:MULTISPECIES: acetyl-CoA carboxylase biotin carboxyl carrier protein [unclassified Paenibacillus]NWL87404.1 acetyl-CoA carboxylase biotin carboxyl carrier protein [Paenibacillus sp. 79R4]